jgi:L-histidine N-alpha-methyltransferase
MTRSIEVVRQPERELRAAYANDVAAAFSKRPFVLPTKYLYDARGSELFAAFAASSSRYYPHAEETLIALHHRRLAELFDGRRLIEFGPGACPRLRQLLALGLAGPDSLYLGVDISEQPMVNVLDSLRVQYPFLLARAYVGDFEGWGSSLAAASDCATLLLWFGNTVANMTDERLIAALRQLAGGVRAPLDLLLGVDLGERRPDVQSRFPDPQGDFSRFRWNALERLNRTFRGDADARNYELVLDYNEELRKAESAFVARTHHCLSLDGLGLAYEFLVGERLVVGITRDLGRDSLASAAKRGGWEITQVYAMPESTYAMVHLHAGAGAQRTELKHVP